MIETFFGGDALSSSAAMLAALVIGLCFGFALERAGFGSSRRLAGIFYFRDMVVLKVMFTAVLVAMIGLQYARDLGLIGEEQMFLMPSVYGAQIVGGLLLGVGFVMGAWCPGTAAVGLASGRWDAAVFLGGVGLGSILFNEMFDMLKGLYTWGDRGVQFAWQAVGLPAEVFVFLFVLVAVGCFWGAEYIERRVTGTGVYWKSPFLKAFSVALVTLAVGLLAIQSGSADGGSPAQSPSEAAILAQVEAAEDHIEPENLADRLMRGESGLLLVDIRPAAEFAAFNIRGAVNIEMAALPTALAPHMNSGLIVLYSNGMTHPAQARDALARMGYANVYLLTEGLDGFRERVLKPASLRVEPLDAGQTTRINAWRNFFMGKGDIKKVEEPVLQLSLSLPTQPTLPGLIEPAWLAENLERPDVRILDVRTQPQYNSLHIPGSVYVSPEHFRGVVGGVSSMLLPPDILARHLSLIGIKPSDTVVIVPSDKPHDATLVSMVFARLGQVKYGILNGGFPRWVAEKHPVTKNLVAIEPSDYPAGPADGFTVDYRQVLEELGGETVIIDVRPADSYTGKKVEEARGGHIPGAFNRPYTEDVTKVGEVVLLKPVDELAEVYAKRIPSKDAKVIVHCRTGHQASQTFFVLRNLLGYNNVFWYDAGWSEWAARPELPVEIP